MNRPLILGSSSPRRQFLMKEAGFSFSVEKPTDDERFPPDMPVFQVVAYLATRKAEMFRLKIHDEIVVTADTVVILDGAILNKPADRNDAIHMLSALSGKTHQVVTGVCILSKEKEEHFDETTQVLFKKLSPTEIERYVDNYRPFDKAGSYGAQECLPVGVNPCSADEMDFLKKINRLDLVQKSFTRTADGGGMVAIEKITGSYFNVMGLPIHKVHEHLIRWV